MHCFWQLVGLHWVVFCCSAGCKRAHREIGKGESLNKACREKKWESCIFIKPICEWELVGVCSIANLIKCHFCGA